MALLRDTANMQLMLFLLIGVGMLATRLGILDEVGRAYMNELLIAIVLPCNIVASFLVDLEPGMLLTLGSTLAIGFGIQLASLALSRVLYRKVPPGQRSVLQYGTICSNATFIGNPVVEGLYGGEGLLYAQLYLVPLRIFIWTAGLSCFTPTTGRQAVKKVVRHPCIIAVAIGFVLMVSGLRPPAFVTGALRSVGNCTTMLSMLIVGSILAGIPWKTVFSRRAFLYSLMRLVLIPAGVLGALLLVQPFAIVIKVSVVLAGMPAGATTAILAAKYNGDAEFASRIIFVSTMLSMVTIPLWAIGLGMILG